MPHRVSGMDTPPDAPRASLDRPASLTAQQLADWDEFERKFFQDYLERHRKEDEDAKLDYETRKARFTVQLMQCQRERSAYEKKLKAVEGRIATLQDGLRGLNDEYKIHCLNVRVSRNRAHFDLQERFKKSREGGPLDTSLVDQLRRVGPPMMNFPIRNDRFDGLDDTADSVSTPTSDGTTEAGEGEVDADEPDSTGVTVCRSDGTIVGTVTKLREEPRLYKNAVDVLLGLPVQRTVVIREGRKFGQAELDNIYRSNDGRFSKWFSFMIQAVGVERPNLCDLCTKNTGPFPTCVRADDASPRCGNCEWSRRGCHDAQDKVSESQDVSDVSDSEPNGIPIVSRQARKSTANAAPAAGSTERSGLRRPIAPAPNRTETPGSRDASEGAEYQRDASPEKSPDPFDFDPEELMSPTITMRQENGVYTHPELMAGVPVEKIDQNHPYWEPNWRDPVDLIRETLAGHEEKYNAHVQNPKDKPAHYKYFQGRQVNRGRSSLEFLENGPFHPFQVVGKRFMQPGITTYDTLHRLAGTLEELGRFKIKISATDWLRQRLCEIMDAEGDRFSLIKAVKDLYHDPKVQALRHLSGFGSVGRPVKGSGGGPKGSGKSKRKRKEAGGSGEASPFSKRVKVAPLSADADEAAASPTTEAAQGSGVPSPAGGPDTTDEDLEYDGCTDTDSVCGETVGDGDFRIREIRTRQHTTSQDMTQYWHLFPNIGLDLLLLQSVDPPQWTQGPPADDFAAAMGDVDEVTYHPESLKVQVLLRSGGEIMAWFYRERTKRRLLALCRAEGRDVRKAASSEYMEVEWTAVCDSDTQQVLTLADFD